MENRITKAQISKIWVLAREIGLDKETLYLLVPRGSISTLTRQEASDLIERLAGTSQEPGRRHERTFTRRPRQRRRKIPATAASPEQWNFIYSLFGKLGWLGTPARMRGFLKKFAGVSTVEEITDRKRASAIIEALKAMCGRQRSVQNVK